MEPERASAVPGVPLLQLSLHWIETRRVAQGAPPLAAFWRSYLGPRPPPSLLFHAQGAQFGVARHLVRRRPFGFYRTLLDELSHRDPVASYYLELLWFEIFRDD